MRERQSLRNPQGRRRNTSTGSDRQSAHPISGSGCRNRPAELRKRCIASIPNDATSIAETGSLPVSRSVLALPNRISTTGCRRQIAAPPRQNGPPPRKDRLVSGAITATDSPESCPKLRCRKKLCLNFPRRSASKKFDIVAYTRAILHHICFRSDQQNKNLSDYEENCLYRYRPARIGHGIVCSEFV